MDDWVVVLQEGDPLSEEQMEVCQELKPSLKGVVLCKNNPTLENPDLCTDIERFPAFCHQPTNTCSYGLRPTSEAMDELSALSNTLETTP